MILPLKPFGFLAQHMCMDEWHLPLPEFLVPNKFRKMKIIKNSNLLQTKIKIANAAINKNKY